MQHGCSKSETSPWGVLLREKFSYGFGCWSVLSRLEVRVKTLFGLCFGLLVSFPSLGEDHARAKWSRYIREFRAEHNFSLLTGLSVGTWNVRQLAGIKGRTIQGRASRVVGEYAFHIPLYGPLGYSLGTSVSMQVWDRDEVQLIEVGSEFGIPGLKVGLIWNVNEGTRLGMSAGAQLARIHRLTVHNGVNGTVDNHAIYVTCEVFEGGVSGEFFFRLGWALRVDASYRKLLYQEPIAASDLPVRGRFEREERWFGLGVTYHYL